MNEQRRHSEAGSILILTLCVLALLSIMAYGLVARVRLGLRQEEWATASSEADTMVSALAGYVIARMEKDADENSDSYGEEWTRPYVADSEQVLADYEGIDATKRPFVLSARVVDERGKFNVNLVSKPVLVQLMTTAGAGLDAADIADAIVNWRSPSATGLSDSNYYASLDPPYEPAGAAFKSVDELLFVRGVSPKLFFGEDENRNGILEPDEDDGDNKIRPGLVDVLTVQGDEAINVNMAQDDVIRVALESALQNDTLAGTVAAAILSQRRGPDGKDGTEDDKPFANTEVGGDLYKTVVAALGSDREAEAALAVDPFGVTSDFFTFVLRVELPESHLTKTVEMVVSREEKAISILEWHES